MRSQLFASRVFPGQRVHSWTQGAGRTTMRFKLHVRGQAVGLRQPESEAEPRSCEFVAALLVLWSPTFGPRFDIVEGSTLCTICVPIVALGRRVKGPLNTHSYNTNPNVSRIVISVSGWLENHPYLVLWVAVRVRCHTSPALPKLQSQGARLLALP
jgi:hypothetical protein